ALAALAPAFDYGLYGLQAHAVVFSLWPAMSRTYERLWAIVETWSGETSEALLSFRGRLQRIMRLLRETLLGTEERRVSREQVYADMYARCACALGDLSVRTTLAEHIAPVGAAHHASAAERLRTVVRRRFCSTAASDSPELERVVTALMDYFRQEQAI